MRLHNYVFTFTLILVSAFCRDLSEDERSTRAAFIQKLLNKQKRMEGKVKLLGGESSFEGNIYIHHAGRWGAVCDDSWDNAAATVVCRTFNRTGVATHGGQYGEALGSVFIPLRQQNAKDVKFMVIDKRQIVCIRFLTKYMENDNFVTEKFWMDDVVCEGTETALNHCIFSGWGSSDCDISEAAGVICNEEEIRADEIQTRYLHEVIDVRGASLRLVGGRNSFEGRVEVYYNNVWGSICPDGWTLYEASAICHHLALGYAEQALQTDYFGSSRIILSGVQCEGNETNLFSCKHRQFGNVMCPGDKGHVAAVICSHYLADLLLDTNAIESSAHLQDAPMFQLQCAMEENCLSKSAYEIQKTNPNWQFETRRLLRFTAASLNIGNAEFRPYLPKHLWQWHLCHMHYHSMEVFATFDVLDSFGQRIAEGHKASFCLEDNTCLPGIEKKYSCLNYGDQGVSVNCSDIYQYNIDCQWVDVTDVVPGDYTFKVTVNPHARVAEQSFHNNAASCFLRLTETYAAVYGCKLGRP